MENSLSKYTTENFEEISWHDNRIHGLSFDQENYESNVVFDIDYILNWYCEGGESFEVARANLVFHNVTDLHIVVDWGGSGYQNSVVGMYIVDVRREIVETPLRLPKYYKWVIELNDDKSTITFGASGFSLNIITTPIIVGQQFLTKKQRKCD